MPTRSEMRKIRQTSEWLATRTPDGLRAMKRACLWRMQDCVKADVHYGRDPVVNGLLVKRAEGDHDADQFDRLTAALEMKGEAP